MVCEEFALLRRDTCMLCKNHDEIVPNILLARGDERFDKAQTNPELPCPGL